MSAAAEAPASPGAEGGSCCVSLDLPAAGLELFEAVLAPLGGALVSDAPTDSGRPLTLRLYLDEAPEPAALTALLAEAAAAAGIDPPPPRIERLAARDWVAESQAALPPIATARLWLHGRHVAGPPPAGRAPLLIEAAAAFGTGRHETTLGCLLALERLARRRRVRRLLDMGCGSGVLALAAARLWPAARVLGVDEDPRAVAVARGNARANGLGGRVRVVPGQGYRPAALRGWGAFDLVTANILARPLAAMAPGLRRALAPGGLAVLAGLLRTQERQVLAPHEALGLRLVRREVFGDWSVLVLRAPGSRPARADP